MSKICLMPKTIEEVYLDIDAVIIGLTNYNSLNTLELNFEDIKNLTKNYDKEIYISINKLIHDSEIDELEIVLKKLATLDLNGILFDDLSIIQIVKEYNLNLNLYWANFHQTTNYNTINSYSNLGIKGVLISPDITLNEIIQINNNISIKSFVPIFGMFEIFSSNRYLITNYLKYINKNKKDNVYYIENNNNKYPIYEDNNGTHIINSNITNGLTEYIEILKNDIDYAVINSYSVKNIDKVIKNFNIVKEMYETNSINYEKIQELSNELTVNIDKGFLYKETIYKVKSDVNEK